MRPGADWLELLVATGVQWLLGCDTPEKWLELCITKRILRPFAAHAYISAQIAIRGPFDRPSDRATFRATDQAGHMILHIGQRKNGRKCHAVTRVLVGGGGGCGGDGGGVRELGVSDD